MSSPPKALQHSAPKELFSAQRAYDHVRRVAQTPHSIGTPAHAKVRDYIMDECSRLKLQTGIQHTTATRTLGGRIMAGNIHNIIASIKGRVGEKAIVLMAHYDSQPHTPGAGDDGAGVAALLETARLLKESKPLKNDVILLFTDGEEVGLLGAQAFVTESKLLSKVALVINLEGRGNTGVSTMFEVNPENGWIMMEYANGAAYPMANSLSFEIYKKLPNDTDYSIFKEAGIAGLNHAFIEGFANYHSMTDTPDNLNLNSLQHHGENMVSLVKHFGNIDLVQTKGADRSYFNILGSWLVQYPGSWNFLFVVIGNVLTITILCTGLIKKRTHIKGVLAGFTFFPLLILLSSLIIMLFLKAIKWYYPLYNNFYAANSYNCYYYFFAIISLGIAIYVLPLAWVCKKFSIDSILTGILVVVTIILTALYQVAPTASYIVFLPLVSIGCAHLIVILKNLDYALQPRPYEALFFLGALPSLLLLCPTLYLMFSAFGLSNQTPFIMVILGLLISMLLPLLVTTFNYDRYLIAGLAITCCLAALCLGHLKSFFSQDKPLQTHFRYELDATSGKANWITDHSIDIGNRNFFPHPKLDSIHPWQMLNAAPILPLEAPILSILQDTTINNVRKLQFHCSNHRNAHAVFFNFSPENQIYRMSIDGKEVRQVKKSRPIFELNYYGFPSNGFSMLVEIKNGPFDFWVEDLTIGLPKFPKYPYYSPGTIPGPGYQSNTTIVKKHYVF